MEEIIKRLKTIEAVLIEIKQAQITNSKVGKEVKDGIAYIIEDMKKDSEVTDETGMNDYELEVDEPQTPRKPKYKGY